MRLVAFLEFAGLKLVQSVYLLDFTDLCGVCESHVGTPVTRLFSTKCKMVNLQCSITTLQRCNIVTFYHVHDYDI